MSIRFRIDAQLPARLAVELQDAGHAAEHVAQLPGGMHLSDQVIWTMSAADGCCIVTKDQDFIDRALVHGPPPQVVHVRLGNCSNIELVTQIRPSLPLIVELLSKPDCAWVVLARDAIVMHHAMPRSG